MQDNIAGRTEGLHLKAQADPAMGIVVAGEVAAKVVFEDAISLAFLDIRPAAPVMRTVDTRANLSHQPASTRNFVRRYNGSMTTADELRQVLGPIGIWMPPPARSGIDPEKYGREITGPEYPATLDYIIAGVAG